MSQAVKLVLKAYNNTGVSSKKAKESPHFAFGRLFELVSDGHIKLPILDKKLTQAMDTIKKLTKGTNTWLDLHGENIMVRRGPAGVQLVFTDPLAAGDW